MTFYYDTLQVLILRYFSVERCTTFWVNKLPGKQNNVVQNKYIKSTNIFTGQKDMQYWKKHSYH